MVVKAKIEKIFNRLLNLILGLAALVCLWILLQVFFFTSFRIPSDSMEPELIAGDCVFVNKLLMGPRLFNLSASMKGEQVEIYRLPGLQKVHRNDVLVFNFPHPNKWDKIEMHIMKYYIKRCIGIPGDTLSIHNGFYAVKRVTTSLGNLKSQAELSKLDSYMANEKVFNSYPDSTIIEWSIKNYGPLYIPRKGDIITMTHKNFILYHKLIKWEQKECYTEKDCDIFINNQLLTKYCFRHNYYFMAGDHTINSQDSRYWGLLPEEFIVGKATLIWKSIDPYNQKFRWSRFIKTIR